MRRHSPIEAPLFPSRGEADHDHDVSVAAAADDGGGTAAVQRCFCLSPDLSRRWRKTMMAAAAMDGWNEVKASSQFVRRRRRRRRRKASIGIGPAAHLAA